MRFLTFECPTCKTASDVEANKVSGLDEIIEEERDEAYSSGKDDERAWGIRPDLIEPGSVIGGEEPLRKLAAAIRSRNFEASEYWLDRLAEAFSIDGTEAVSRGRFSDQGTVMLETL